MKTARTRKERVKRVEYHLKNYRQYLVAIANIDRQAKIIQADALPNITANYDLREGSVGTFIVRSGTEDAAIRNIDRPPLPESMIRERAMFEVITESIDAALKMLTKQERRFIERHYFDGVEISELAHEFNASASMLYIIRNGAFDKLLISLSAIEDY